MVHVDMYKCIFQIFHVVGLWVCMYTMTPLSIIFWLHCVDCLLKEEIIVPWEN